MTKSNSDEDRYCERMDFPNTFNEFAEQYGFVDKEEHYTNSSQLIPVFRVKQWLNHIPNNTENMTVEQYRARMIEAFHNADCDCLIALVSLPTEKEFEHLEWLLKNYYKKQSNSDEDCISRAEALKCFTWTNTKDDAWRAINDLPTIQPTAKENLVVEDCISFPKGTLKKRGKGYVIYNYDWLKENWQTELKAMGIEPSIQPKSETWEGIHAQITAPKGTFDKIWNEAKEDNDEI